MRVHRTNVPRLRAGLSVGMSLAALVLTGCGGSGTTPSGPFNAEITASVAAGPILVQHVSYTTFDGSRVAALFSLPRAAPPRGCLIWENGLGSMKQAVAPLWPGAARLGLAVFTIDLRYNGARMTQPGQLARVVRDPAALKALVTGTVGDLQRAIGYLSQQPLCRRNISYAGLSMGGIIGSVLAAQDKRIRAVILMSVPPSWRALIASASQVILPGIERHPDRLRAAVAELSPLDPDRWIGRISPRPVLLLIGRHDPVVPPAAAQQTEEAARPPKTVVNYDGSHIPLFGSAAAANAAAIGAFLLRTVVEPSYSGSA